MCSIFSTNVRAAARSSSFGWSAARTGGEFSLRGERAEDFAVRTEQIGGACERGDGVLGADICAVRLEEDDARTVDLGQVCLHEIVGAAAPQPVAERDDIVRGEIRRRVLHAEDVTARCDCNLLGDCLCVAGGG